MKKKYIWSVESKKNDSLFCASTIDIYNFDVIEVGVKNNVLFTTI